MHVIGEVLLPPAAPASPAAAAALPQPLDQNFPSLRVDSPADDTREVEMMTGSQDTTHTTGRQVRSRSRRGAAFPRTEDSSSDLTRQTHQAALRDDI